MKLTLERVDPSHCAWADLDAFPDRVVFQTREWLSFLAASQHAEPVIAAVRADQATVGYFTGSIVRRYGVRMLGSPLPGWTTDYMGFNLVDGVERQAALEALLGFAFNGLRCSHVEVRDRRLRSADLESLQVEQSPAPTYVIDLRADEDVLLSRMTSACRRNLKKADRVGVVIEEASDPGFADEYYAQLRDVFAKQNLVPTYGVERVRTLIEHLLPSDNLLLLRARDSDGTCIATAIFPMFNTTTYFWGGASWRVHQHLRPNEALIWYAMQYSRRRGLTEFDFSGGGTYKRKYGASELVIPHVRKSRFGALSRMRQVARTSIALRQRGLGRLESLRRGS
jgi:CelD/BcsL family acetyltransferase involved in cellulose biosynthesis